jgi:hypothetical protein
MSRVLLIHIHILYEYIVFSHMLVRAHVILHRLGSEHSLAAYYGRIRTYKDTNSQCMLVHIMLMHGHTGVGGGHPLAAGHDRTFNKYTSIQCASICE